MLEALDNLSKKNGSFPMPLIGNKDHQYTRNQVNNNIPAKVTPEYHKFHKDIVEILDGETSIGRRHPCLQLQKQQNVRGFPIPPFDVNDSSANTASNIDTFRTNTNTPQGRDNDHHRQRPRPPNLESIKKLWYDICIVQGDDPKVDEHLCKEIFEQKVQRGEFPTTQTHNIYNTFDSSNTKEQD